MKTPYHVEVLTNDDAEMVVCFYHQKDELPEPTTHIVDNTYESRICALRDIQDWVIKGKLHEYDDNYQRYDRWICIYCNKENTSTDRKSEQTCSNCGKPRISNEPSN